MQLNRLILKGYKSIKQTEIELNHLNVFIGANGAGKSNFISFFHLLNAIINEQLRIFVPKNCFADAFLHYGRKHTQAIEAHLELGRHGYQFRLEPTADNRFIFTDESLTITTRIVYNKGLDRHDADPQKQEVTHLGLGHSESNLSQFENNSLAQRILPIISVFFRVFPWQNLSKQITQVIDPYDPPFCKIAEGGCCNIEYVPNIPAKLPASMPSVINSAPKLTRWQSCRTG